METKLETIEDIQEFIDYCTYDNESEENARLIKKCIQKAVVLKNRELEFDARYAYIYQMSQLNYKEEALTMFPWLLKEIDTEEKSWSDIHNVIWMYKWIIINLPDFAHISTETIEDLLNDIDRRIRDRGASGRMGDYLKMTTYGYMGHEEKFLAYKKKYLSASNKNEEFDDCAACQANNLIYVLILYKEYEKANEYFEPLLNKKVSCAEVPKSSYQTLALINKFLGKDEDAKKLEQLAKRNISFDKKPYLTKAGDLIMYYALEKDFIKGRTVLEKQIHFCNRRQPEYYLFKFYAGCLLLFSAMKKAGKSQMTINVKETIFTLDEENVLELDSAIKTLDIKTDKLAKQLDTRNGNTFNQDMKAYWLTYL